MTLARLAPIPLILATALACVEDVGKDSVAATVEEAPAAEQAAPPEAPADVATWTVDAEASKIQALGAKITATHPIVFHTFEGTLGVKDGEVATVAFTVQMDSLEADHPKLTGHLKNEDFFDVPNHPTSTFQSVSVKAGSDAEGATHTVSGDLTIRGTTKRVTFPATIAVAEGEAKATTEFVLNRQDFGVTYPGRPDDLVQDNVKMTIALVAKAR